MALVFNGTSGVVNLANNAASVQPAKFTVAAWFYLNSTGVSMTVACKPDSAAPWSSPYASWLVRFDSPNKIEFGTAQAGSYGALLSTISVLPQTWNHVACTFDGVTKRCYYNGALVGSAASAQSMTYTSQPLLIGGDTSASPYGDCYSGMLEDVRYYSRALNGGEVQNLAKSREKYSDNTLGLIGYWPLDEAPLGSSLVGLPVYDRSPNGNHGVGVGSGLNGQPTQTLSYKQGFFY